MSWMFKSASEFNQYIGGWDIFNLTEVDPMFFTRYNINKTDNNGKTLLERQSEKNNVSAVYMLLNIKNINVTPKSIANIQNYRLLNRMIRMHVQQHWNNFLEKKFFTIYRKVRDQEKCGEYSINQGNVGICYIVSVITLFRNEKSILEWLKNLKVPEPLKEIIELLDADYSTYDFTKQCPKLPPWMVEAVTENSIPTRRGPLIKNGGNPYVLMMYILNMIDLWTDKTVYFGIKNSFYPSAMGGIAKGQIKKQFNHVIAGCVCDGNVHICNSWGGKCQTNVTEIVKKLIKNGYLELYLQSIGILCSIFLISSIKSVFESRILI